MAPPSKRPAGTASLTTGLRGGDVLKAMRDVLGLSQENFAQKVGVKRQQISAYENGHHSPGIETLAEIALKAGVRVEVTIQGPAVADVPGSPDASSSAL